MTQYIIRTWCNLQVFENYVKDATAKLSRKVEDLEDVRFVMAMLKEVSHQNGTSCNTRLHLLYVFPFSPLSISTFCKNELEGLAM